MTVLSERFAVAPATAPLREAPERTDWCHPRFAAVRAAFEDNFTDRDEIGAAVAVYVDDELVVDLWGGSADAGRTRPWNRDTVVPVYSGSKGLLATCIHQLVDRGVLALDAPVARYWPQFAQAGKDAITLAMVLGHRSGVIGPRHRMTVAEARDWDTVCARLAAAEPWWTPGTAQGYHMMSFGYILGEVVRRVTGLTLARYLRDEIAGPLGLDVQLGLPLEEHHRCADIINKPFAADMFATMAPDASSLQDNPLTALSVCAGYIPDDEISRDDTAAWRCGEHPATNGHVSAIGMASFYNALVHERIVSRPQLERARVSQGGFDRDVCLGPRVADHGWGLGYMLNQRPVAAPNTAIFGHGGSGGSYAFADLEHRIGYSYVMNNFDVTKASADPRSVALSDAVYAALGVYR